MNRPLAVVASVLVLSLTLAAQDARQASVTLKAAQAAETIEQDLPKAITLYERALKEAGSDRALAPQILLQLAQALAKASRVGDGQTAYERIVQEWPNSGEATTARTRLREISAVKPPLTPTTGAVWEVPARRFITGPVSADGRWVAHAGWLVQAVDWARWLVVRDLRTGRERVINPPVRTRDVLDQWADATAFSRDGRFLAVKSSERLEPGDKWTSHLWIVDLSDPNRIPPPRLLLENENPFPYDWTPDGKWLAVRRTREPGVAEVGLVSVETGEVRLLKSQAWPRYSRSTTVLYFFNGFLSPDGKFLAVDYPVGSPGNVDTMVIPTDGGPTIPVADTAGDEFVLGWSPDGSSLLFSSTQASGSLDVWRQPFESGRPAAPPQLLRRGAPATASLGISNDGTLFWSGGAEETLLTQQAVFDFSSGTFTVPPSSVSESRTLQNRAPRWSPDGTRLAYVSQRGSTRLDQVLVIRDLASGRTSEQVLDFAFPSGNVHRWEWAPDGLSILAQGQDPRLASGSAASSDRTALHRIDVATGAISLVAPDEPRPMDLLQALRRRGTKTYSARGLSTGVEIIERDSQTGRDRTVVHLTASPPYDFRLTNDGRSLIAVDVDPATNEGRVVICSVADGSVRTLFRGVRGQTPRVEIVARDDQSLIALSPTREGKNIYWWVPFDGRAPRQLTELAGMDLFWNGARRQTFELHPDGKRIAFQVRQPAGPEQLFELRNLLPSGRR